MKYIMFLIGIGCIYIGQTIAAETDTHAAPHMSAEKAALKPFYVFQKGKLAAKSMYAEESRGAFLVRLQHAPLWRRLFGASPQVVTYVVVANKYGLSDDRERFEKLPVDVQELLRTPADLQYQTMVEASFMRNILLEPEEDCIDQSEDVIPDSVRHLRPLIYIDREAAMFLSQRTNCMRCHDAYCVMYSKKACTCSDCTGKKP